ncbi:MAG: TolC family protein [Gammaproteobacteria bacterium]|jgi:cobalt-zinc-cadmium efflux system outer membrane protein|nr:TolC family protein [Gammaproteobacteria bacterium]
MKKYYILCGNNSSIIEKKETVFKELIIAIFLLHNSFSSLFASERIHQDNNFDGKFRITNSSLNGFISQALDENPSIQAAKANLAAAQSRLEAAGKPLYNPQLIADTQQKRQKNFKDPELAQDGKKPYEKTYIAGFNQTIDWANKRLARTKVADTTVHVSEAQLFALKQQLATEILMAMIRYQAAQKVVMLAKERTSLLQQFVTLTEKRQASGDVARVETDLAQLALSEAIAQQADSEIRSNQAIQVLRATTGLASTTLPVLPDNLPDPNMMNTNIDELLDCLPALKVLAEQFHNAKMRIGLAKRERYADPTIGIQGGQDNTNEGNKRVVLASFSIPLFVRNSYQAEVEAANFDSIEAEKKRMDLIRQIRADIVSTSERYQMLYQSVQESSRIAGKPLNDGIILIQRLWQGGEISTTDYLVQLKQRLDSQIAGAELRERAWQAWGDWLKASGTVEEWLQNK